MLFKNYEHTIKLLIIRQLIFDIMYNLMSHFSLILKSLRLKFIQL